MSYIFVDSDILIRHLRYERDKDRIVNEELIDLMSRQKINAATSIYNVLEVLGIVSFNFNSEKLKELYSHFCSRFNIKILAKISPKGDWIYSLEDVYKCIEQKQSLGDAFVSTIIESFSSQLSAMISWNARHFQNLSIPAMTPKEFLEKRS